jgi:hypothetical protein
MAIWNRSIPHVLLPWMVRNKGPGTSDVQTFRSTSKPTMKSRKTTRLNSLISRRRTNPGFQAFEVKASKEGRERNCLSSAVITKLPVSLRIRVYMTSMAVLLPAIFPLITGGATNKAPWVDDLLHVATLQEHKAQRLVGIDFPNSMDDRNGTGARRVVIGWSGQMRSPVLEMSAPHFPHFTLPHKLSLSIAPPSSHNSLFNSQTFSRVCFPAEPLCTCPPVVSNCARCIGYMRVGEVTSYTRCTTLLVLAPPRCNGVKTVFRVNYLHESQSSLVSLPP